MTSLPNLQTVLCALGIGGAILIGSTAFIGEDKLEPPSALGITTLMAVSSVVGASPFILGKQQAKADLQTSQRQLILETQDFKTRIKEYTSEIESLRQSLSTEKQTALQIGNEALSIRQQLTSKDNQIIELTQSLETTRDTIKTLRSTIAELQKENDEYDTTVAQWEDDFNTRLTAELNNRQATGTLELARLKRQMEDQLESQQLELLKTKRQIETDAETEIQQIKAHYSQQAKSEWAEYYQSQIDNLSADLADAEQECEQLTQQLTLMQERMIPADQVEQAINERSAMLDHTLSETENLSVMCENLQTALDDTTTKLTQALLPITFCPNSDYTPGNVIIQHLHDEHGLIFDAIDRTQSSGKDTYWFRYRGNTDHSPPRPYPSLTNAFALTKDDFAIHLDVKAISELSYHQTRDLFSITITSRHAKLDATEMERRWLGRNRFKAIISPVRSLRATAATEGGKSPLIRNVLGAKLSKGERFKLFRYDTSAGSKKDFWRIAPTWTEFDDANNVAKHMMDLFTQRKTDTKHGINEWDHTIYYAVDEFDNVVANGPKTGTQNLVKAMLTIFKQGSHLGIGILATGQNPNSSIWGAQRNEFNNVWNVHIGDNFHDAIANSNMQISTSDLSLQYEAIRNYSETQNKHIEDITRQCRFGLLLEPGKAPKFMELPFLGSQGFDAEEGSLDYDFAIWDGTQYPPSIKSLDDALAHDRRMKMQLVSPSIPTTHPGHPADSTRVSEVVQAVPGENRATSPELSPIPATHPGHPAAPAGVSEVVQLLPGENRATHPDLSSLPITYPGSPAAPARVSQQSGQIHPNRPMSPSLPHCPQCQQISDRIKEKIDPQKNRYYCDNANCSRQTFTFELKP